MPQRGPIQGGLTKSLPSAQCRPQTPPLPVIPFPAIDPVAFSIGPLAIRWYALAYVFGLLLAVFYAKHLVRRPALWEPGEPPVTPQQLDDFLLWATLGVVLGG